MTSPLTAAPPSRGWIRRLPSQGELAVGQAMVRSGYWLREGRIVRMVSFPTVAPPASVRCALAAL
jgi:hypothetical protein